MFYLIFQTRSCIHRAWKYSSLTSCNLEEKLLEFLIINETNTNRYITACGFKFSTSFNETDENGNRHRWKVHVTSRRDSLIYWRCDVTCANNIFTNPLENGHVQQHAHFRCSREINVSSVHCSRNVLIGGHLLTKGDADSFGKLFIVRFEIQANGHVEIL